MSPREGKGIDGAQGADVALGGKSQERLRVQEEAFGGPEAGQEPDPKEQQLG